MNRHIPLRSRTRIKKRRSKPTREYPDGRVVLSEKDRREQLAYIYERDNRICHLCGKYVRREDASRDHLRIRGMGGAFTDDRPENIKLAHGFCNTQRGSKPLPTRTIEECRFSITRLTRSA